MQELPRALQALEVNVSGKRVMNLADFTGTLTTQIEEVGGEGVIVSPDIGTSMADRIAVGIAYPCLGEDFLRGKRDLANTFDVITNLYMTSTNYLESHLKMLPMIVTALKPDGVFVMGLETISPDTLQDPRARLMAVAMGLDKTFNPRAAQDFYRELKKYFKKVEIVSTPGDPRLWEFSTPTIIKCSGPIKNVERTRIATQPIAKNVWSLDRKNPEIGEGIV